MSKLSINKLAGNGHVIGDNNNIKNNFGYREVKDSSVTDEQKNRDQNMTEAPKVFISYAWEEETSEWVKKLATQLRGDGIDVTIDRWSLSPGDQLTQFMEQSVRENDYVLIICTPKYKEKSNQRLGGVGYEGDIMTAEVFARGNHRKFIPILKSDNQSVPTWLSGKMYIDLASEYVFERGYQDLIATLFQTREKAPPLGGKSDQNFKSVNGSAIPVGSQNEEIKIQGILADEVTIPSRDGTRGSALYAVPFELNKVPTHEWIELFIASWNHPPRFTSMHRPGIATVSGKKIILDGTDIEEVKRYHRDTLILAVEEANKKYKQITDAKNLRLQLEKQQQDEHRRQVEDLSKQIKFD